MTFTFEIPGRLPGLNDIIRTARGNIYAAANQKKTYQRICAGCITASVVPVFKEPVMITFAWFEPDARRDIDNVCAGGTKFILDALVETGRLCNDTREWVKGLAHIFPAPDKKNPRIRITIDEITGGANGNKAEAVTGHGSDGQ